MKNYFETKVTYNQISFHLSNSPNIDEREIHPYHEILLYIVGDTELLTKDGQHTPKKKSLIMIPKETYHFFRPKSSNEFVRLKISIPSDWVENEQLSYLMSKMKFFENLNENISFVFDRLYNVLKNKTNRVGFYAYSAFLMLITELDISGMEETPGSRTENSRLMTDLIEYISENLSECGLEIKESHLINNLIAYINQNFNRDISLEEISKEFYIDKFYISRLFKEQVGVTIWNYVIFRRLTAFNDLICADTSIEDAYMRVGFQNYSNFFRLYKKHMNMTPSQFKKKALGK